MRTPNEWASLILSDLRGDQSAVEQHEVLQAYIKLIQHESVTHSETEMSEKPYNEPAFPMPPVGTGDPRDGMAGGHDGMSLRDWFAGCVLKGKAGYRTLQTVEEMELAALQCYSMADAMLVERAKGQP